MARNENEHILKGEGKKMHHEEEIVIIGGGMGGLCFAAALHRVGLKAVVLEQSDRLRAEGTSITLWNNAMKALELLDIADQLRNTYVNVLGYDFISHRCKIIVMWLLENHFKIKKFKYNFCFL
jgi:2-polyprenyl-6-methoxyphenol hydroxylase-like FAD-dependent oxidoreductase